jgi:hypothetical protein
MKFKQNKIQDFEVAQALSPFRRLVLIALIYHLLLLT